MFVLPIRNQKFVDNTLQVDFLGRDQRKSVLEIEAHLVAEAADRSGSGSIAFLCPVIEDVLRRLR